MDIIVKNNMRIFQEVNENMLCVALEDLIRERLEREVNIKVNEVVKEKIHNQTPLNEIRKRYHLTDAEWSWLEKLALY